MKKENLTFGEALEALKKGERIARKGWNGKGMFLFILPAGEIPKKVIHDANLKKVADEVEEDTFSALSSIRMFTADKKNINRLVSISNRYVIRRLGYFVI